MLGSESRSKNTIVLLDPRALLAGLQLVPRGQVGQIDQMVTDTREGGLPLEMEKHNVRPAA